ncbi:MAG: class I SAM-dependent methyltransferase [Nitrospirota bacterium]
MGKIYDLLINILTFFAGGDKRYRKKILDMAEPSPGERILDLCCGTGTLTKLICERGNDSGVVIGVDYSYEMLLLAEEKTNHLSNIKYSVADGKYLPFRDLSFAQVFICMALHEMPVNDRKKVIKEVYRVLKDDGMGIFIEFDQPEKPTFRYKLVIKMEEVWDKEAIGDFKKANFIDELKEGGFIMTKTALALGNCIRIMVMKKRG